MGRRLVTGVILAVLSIVAAVAGLGVSYDELVTPRSNTGELAKVYGDGWVEDGATISFRGLAPRGNRLVLSFNSWLPPGLTSAEFEAALCGEVVSRFSVSPVLEHSIYLTGTCEPRTVALKVLTPFIPSAEDQRRLGAQLLSARIVSRLGVPLVEPRVMAATALGIFGVALLTTFALPGLWGRGVAFAVPVVAFLLLWHAEYGYLQKLEALCLLALAVSGGAALAAQRRDRRDGEGESLTGMTVALLLGVVVAVGATLRFYGITFGLPANYHPDEVPKVNAIMRMVEQGNLDPRYFLHPSLLLYSSYLTNTLFHWFGMEGTFRETAFLAGRVVSATAGTISIALIFLIGRHLFGAVTGLLGAAFLAVYPLHVTCSRYMKEDALLTSLLLLTTWLVVKAARENRIWCLLLAGLCAGFSASSKYSGMLAAMIVVGAPFLRSGRFVPDWRFAKFTLMALALMPLGFVMLTPYSVLTPAKFLKDFGSERNHMMRGHTITIDAWSQFWMYHFARSIVPGMSLLNTLVALVGLGILAWRRRMQDLYLIALVLLFYLPAEWVKAKPEPQPERYILPCLPFLALAAGEAVRWLARARLGIVAVVVTAVILALPVRRTVQLASEIKLDTRDQMAQWMLTNLPRGSKIYLDWKPYAPRFWHNEFEITYVPRATIIEKLLLNDLKKSGQDYMVLSGLFYERYFTQPEGEGAIRQLLRNVFERVPVVKEFAPVHGTYGFHNPRLTLFSLQGEDFARLEEELAAKRAGRLERTSNEERAQFRWSLSGQ